MSPYKSNLVMSKSEFMMFLKHPAWLWLKKFDKTKLPEVEADLQARFDEGTLFEGYAEQIFPDALRLGYKHPNGEFSGTMYYALPQVTEAEIKKGTKVILQGRIEVGQLTSIFDVLENVGDGQFDLYEIKSSTAVKDEHVWDLAFQTIVLERAGYQIRNICVVHVNNKYERDGDIDPHKITTVADLTEDARAIIPEVEAKIEEALKVLSLKTCPDISLRNLNGGYDAVQEWLEIFRNIKGDLPRYSIYDLAGPKPEQIGALEDEGILEMSEIKDTSILNDKQLRQVAAVQSGERSVDEDAIREFLGIFTFPLHFFDYETLSGVIPAFDGVRPYQQVPFQYSLHIQDAPGGSLRHKEYLHTENTLPSEPLIKQMIEDFEGNGSIVSWNMKFEKARNTELAKAYPKYEKFLVGLNDRMVDLMIPFQKGWFVDKDFFGSASIKAVLPVLLPELSYKELEISQGGQAQRVWMETVLKGQNSETKEEIMGHLIKYCTLDTYAMYAIYKYLIDLLK